MHSTKRRSGGLAGCSIVVAIALVTLVAPSHARAHEALSGWSYPLDCCSNRDCRAIQASSVRERPEGYVIEPSGETISYSDPRLRVSPDGVYHWCALTFREGARTICLFVPPQSF